MAHAFWQLAAESRRSKAWEGALRHVLQALDPDSGTRRGAAREALPSPVFNDLVASEVAAKAIESIAAW